MKIVYPAKHTVSIWIGTFATQNDFEDAVRTSVMLKLQLPDGLEFACEFGYQSSPASVVHAFDGFSGYQTFSTAACEAAAARSISATNAALVCYDLACEAAPAQWGALSFLGSFVGSDRTQ